MKYLLGLDIGGTKIELVALPQNFQKFSKLPLVFQERIPTERHKGYTHILRQIEILYQRCLQHLKISSRQVVSLGLSLPGSVDPRTQKMILGNTLVLKNKSLISDLKRRLKVSRVWAENDANCFALAECHLGAGRIKASKSKTQTLNCVGFILGTGMGSGIVIEGRIYSGRRGAAGEIGHIPLGTSGRCYCQQIGCTELFLSGEGLKNRYFKETGQRARATEILNQTVWAKEYRAHLAQVIGRVVNTLDPDFIVLGGGVSRHPAIYKGLKKEIQKHLFIRKSPPPVYNHKISDSAGSVGAALLAVFAKKL